MDSESALLRFGADVTQALKAANVAPQDGCLCAIMIIAHPVDEDGNPTAPPVGASINFDKDTREWESTMQLAEVNRLDD